MITDAYIRFNVPTTDPSLMTILYPIDRQDRQTMFDGVLSVSRYQPRGDSHDTYPTQTHRRPHA